MADLYLTPAEKYTAALGGFYYVYLPKPGTVYTQLIKDVLDGSTPDKEPKNILARFIYSLYISDLGDLLTTVKPSSMSIEYTSADENQSRQKRISLLKKPLAKRI